MYRQRDTAMTYGVRYLLGISDTYFMLGDKKVSLRWCFVVRSLAREITSVRGHSKSGGINWLALRGSFAGFLIPHL